MKKKPTIEELQSTVRLQNNDLNWFREQLKEVREQRDEWFRKATDEDNSIWFWRGLSMALSAALILEVVAHYHH